MSLKHPARFRLETFAPSRRLLAWLRGMRDRAATATGKEAPPPREPADAEWQAVLRSFHRDPEAAVAAFARFNSVSTEELPEDVADLVRRAVEFNYMGWPRQMREHLTGRRVLDIGCKNALSAVAFRTVGVRSYTGVDPGLDLDDPFARNKRTRRSEDLGRTPRHVAALMGATEFVPCAIQDLDGFGPFEVVVLHNVTEHLADLPDVLASLPRLMASDGVLIYNHHNYYSWNGHHQAPRTVHDIDPDDAAQRILLDWGHVEFEPPPGHYIARSLNRIRMDDLRRITQAHFVIDTWLEKPSKPEQGRDRLTSEFMARYPYLDERHFLTQNVVCIARLQP